MSKCGRKSFEELGKINKEIVYNLYIEQSLSISAAANSLGVSVGTFARYLRNYDIKRRSRGNRRSKKTDVPSAPTTDQQSFESQVTEQGGAGFDGI